MGYATAIDKRANPETHCFYCGRKISHVSSMSDKSTPKHARTQDHVIPKSKGGDDVVFACLGCNDDKRDLTLEEYRLVLAFRRGLLNIQIPYTFFGEAR